MTASGNKQAHLDSVKLDLLFRGGVDNWSGYQYAIDDASDANNDSDVLNALENGGVDNWEWYDESLNDFSEYTDYVNSTADFKDVVGFDQWRDNNASNTASNNANTASNVDNESAESARDETPKVVPLVNALDSLGRADCYDKVVERGVLRRNFAPRVFDTAVKNNKDGRIDSIRAEYVALLVKTGILAKLVKEVS